MPLYIREGATMKLKEIIELSKSIIGLDSVSDYDNPGEATLKLIDCARMIYSELCLEYVPIKFKEEAFLSKGVLKYSELTYPVREILWIKMMDSKVPFKMGVHQASIKYKVDSPCEVYYSVHPAEPGIDDELILPPWYTAHLIATGVVSEYYYRVGMVDEALFYRTRYDHSLQNLTKSIRSYTLPRRRFI